VGGVKARADLVEVSAGALPLLCRTALAAVRGAYCRIEGRE
jgi:hypothetical protein